jgi:hypothetical protein
MLSHACSQTVNKIFLEIKYPVPAGANFLTSAYYDGYTGFFDARLGYGRKFSDQFGAGAAFNTTFLRLPETNMNAMVLCPALQGFYYFPVERKRNKVTQMIEIGYSFWSFFTDNLNFPSDSSIVTNPDGHYRERRHGFTLGSSTKVSYFISDRISIDFIIELNFHRIRAIKKEERSGYNQNVAIIYPGLGISLDL